MALDFCDLLWKMRGRFFAKDRDITLMSDRMLILGDGTEIPSSALVPVGGIILWSGSIGSIPANWQICDGTNSTPNLRNRFVVGAGDTYAVDDTGGAATIDIQHSHGDGTLAAASDSHNHGNGSLAAASPANNSALFELGVTQQGPALAHGHTVTGSTASDSHSHDVTGSTASTLSTTQSILPLFYALAYIQRLS